MDDLKGTATRATADSLLAFFEKMVGKCKADFVSFTHIGIQHEHKEGEVYTHQFVYVDAIKPIPTSTYKGMEDEKLVTLTPLHDLFRSCIGAIA